MRLTSDILAPLITTGSQAPFFIVPAVGATPVSLVRLVRSLDVPSPVYSFSTPGLDGGESSFQSVEAAARGYFDEILAVQKEGPYYLAGHCGGGLVAHAIAAEMERQNLPIGALIMIDAIPPNPMAGSSGPGSVLEDVNGTTEADLMPVYQNILDDAYIKLAQIPEAYAERIRRSLMPLFLSAGHYQGQLLDTPITLVRTRTHPEAVYQRWQNFTTSSVDEHILGGDESTLLKNPYVVELGGKITEILEASRAGQGI